VLCASSCSSHFGKDDFLASIEAGVRQAGRQWVFEALYGAAFDHPVLPAFPEGDYLKFAMGRVHWEDPRNAGWSGRRRNTL
jgi:23S rRNA (cytosine1962-C5)-methyltransferase